MAEIILDFGSATTCKNDIIYVRRMIDELAKVDTGKHNVVIKWQLFEKAINSLPDGTILDPPVQLLKPMVFSYAYHYAKEKGYKTTASVFDLSSLKYLLAFDIPFVKLANRPELYWLAEEVPRKTPVYVSVGSLTQTIPKVLEGHSRYWEALLCVSRYPASAAKYKNVFGHFLGHGISDHTTGFDLWYKYQPAIIEWHYKLPDSTGYDAGAFARTPEQLKEVL